MNDYTGSIKLGKPDGEGIFSTLMVQSILDAGKMESNIDKESLR